MVIHNEIVDPKAMHVALESKTDLMKSGDLYLFCFLYLLFAQENKSALYMVIIHQKL